ncbi:hypothetical protein [Psychrobacillus sp. FSL K6-1464]|uniref:hypothetical protein n=1 Tax=Psychrobacillus sp. FSL K6-1464 TaxID=2921545 RepID=UPI0030F662FB
MCPNCLSQEVADLLSKTNNLESFLKLKKCHECDRVFLTFDFGYADETEMEVEMV